MCLAKEIEGRFPDPKLTVLTLSGKTHMDFTGWARFKTGNAQKLLICVFAFLYVVVIVYPHTTGLLNWICRTRG